MNRTRTLPEPARARRGVLRVIWVTNHSAPYRRPVWEALGARLRFKVALADNRIGSDPRSNRRADWAEGNVVGYAIDVLGTLRIRRGESTYYVGVGLPKMGSVDVVVLGGWESPFFWQLASLARLAGARRVGFYESHEKSIAHAGGPIGALRKRWFRRLDAVVVPGAASARAVRALGVEPSRVFTGFNAVDVAGIAAEARAHRTAYEGHRFIYIGQLIIRKNVVSLVRAFKDVRLETDRLTIVGVGDEDAEIRGLVHELGMREAVDFLGYVPQARLGETLAQADTLVLPSHAEVWGLVVNEALAAGLQVVVSAAAGVAEDVVGMPGVWVVQPDQQSLAHGLADARESFRGPIADPPILDFTPERFADVFIDAFRFAIEHPLHARSVLDVVRRTGDPGSTMRREVSAGDHLDEGVRDDPR